MHEFNIFWTVDVKEVYGVDKWTTFVVQATTRGTPAQEWLEGDDEVFKRRCDCHCLLTIAGSGKPRAREQLRLWLVHVGSGLKATPTNWSRVNLDLSGPGVLEPMEEAERDALIRSRAGEDEDW